MQENFTILNQGAALERPTFSVNLLLFRVPGLCRIAILDCFTIHGILQIISASSSQELRPDIAGNTKRPESETRREPQNSSILVPRFQSGGGLLDIGESILTVV